MYRLHRENVDTKKQPDKTKIEEAQNFFSCFYRNTFRFITQKDPRNFSSIVNNLDNKFYVSSENKSLYESLREAQKSSKKQENSLISRIGTFY